jgi:hypothetical protein
MRLGWVPALLVATAASGQVLWVGAKVGTSWEQNSPTAPDRTFLHYTDSVRSIFVGIPLSDDTMLRFQTTQLPHDTVIGSTTYSTRIRGYSVGIDYSFKGTIGQPHLSLSFGGYRREFDGGTPEGAGDTTRFGWSAGAGEWLSISRRGKVVLELEYHRADFPDKPKLISATAGLAFSF